MTDTALPWSGQPYSTRRHGATITNCDSEPVRTPGCVQAHGALLVLRKQDMQVLQASDNARVMLGLGSGRGLLGEDAQALLGGDALQRLRQVLALPGGIERNPTYLLTLPASGAHAALDLTAHEIDGRLLVEIEPAAATGPGQPDYYALIKSSVARLQTATGLRHFCEMACDEVRALTGMDRVMTYKFHADGHGEVFAESRPDELAPWLGLHYPAEDIPAPAREIFQRTWIRPLPDVSGQLAELVPLADPESGKPLEMTHCALRGASLMYTEYLRNMGVTAGLTLSIRRDTLLWGLIACHHYQGPRHLPYQVRAACEFLAQLVSLQHRAAEDREMAAYRLRLEQVHQDLVATAAAEGGLSALTDGSPTLLNAVSAGGAALYHRDRWWRVGSTPSDKELDALSAWLLRRPAIVEGPRLLFSTDSLAAEFPPAAAYASKASGVLAALLSRNGRSMMLWFRPETIQTVNWGGNPHDKPTVVGPNGPRLTPRRSFELFQESVRMRSLPWLDVEVEAASRLRLMVMDLVVNRAEQLAGLNLDLERSNAELDAFAYVASHDLKEPLRGIYKYAHQLAESPQFVGEENRPKLEALLRLTTRMDGLLESLLHFSRVGRTELELEPVDLDEVLAEAIEMVGSRTAERAARITAPRPLPTLNCDRVRCREVLTNLLSNALKYNDKPVCEVEVGYIAAEEACARSGFPPQSASHVVLFVRDNGIGIDPRHHEQIFKMFKRLHGRDEFGGGTGAGLTIVRKLVQRHHGDIWLQSAPGDGATFFFTLPGPGAEAG